MSAPHKPTQDTRRVQGCYLPPLPVMVPCPACGCTARRVVRLDDTTLVDILCMPLFEVLHDCATALAQNERVARLRTDPDAWAQMQAVSDAARREARGKENIWLCIL